MGARVETTWVGYQAPFSYGSGGVSVYRVPTLERTISSACSATSKSGNRFLYSAGSARADA
jgi:hypothetical protein